MAGRRNRGEMKGGLGIFAIVIVLSVAGLFAIGILPRIQQGKELSQMHKETVDAIPTVHTIIAKPAKGMEALTLPGNIGAIYYTTIYARVDGYLKSRLVDIGDHVKTGQLLAEIDTPTIDQKVEQARADLDEQKATLKSAQAQWREAIAKDDTAKADVEKNKANNDYADITAKRWINLCERGAVSQQHRDEKVRSFEATTAELAASKANEKAAQASVQSAKAQVGVAQAGVVAKKANLDRELADQSFKHVLAPFEGVITYRKVDPGALITQGSQTNSLELFQMAKIDKLRIYINVPQRVARYLKAGMQAQILVPEYPEMNFIGKITNVSGALDPNTRTRQTEVQIDNPKHYLLPGMYAEVKVTALRGTPWIRVPGTTVVTEPDGLFVVVVQNGKAHYQPITIGRDFGDEVEVRAGLKGDEQVVISPSDDLREGDPVTTALAEAPQAKP